MQKEYPFIEKQDPEVASLLTKETERQENVVRLIASENYVSRAVLEATGSPLTNKYSEGYPYRRYYKGQEVIDILETLTIERAKALFGAEHANVQPYSGSPANMEAYYAFLEPGDTILGMSLPHGGHLTHGWKVSASARFYKSVQYPIDEKTNRLNMATVRELAKECKPKLILAGASAYPRIIDFAAFREIADEVGAYLMVDMAHIAGLVAAGVHPSPVPYADVVTTTTHKTLRGPRGALILCKEQYAKKVDSAVFPANQGGPHNHTTAGMAVAFKEAASDSFKAYGRKVVENAAALADEFLKLGFNLVTGGTDNHLILIDLRNKGLKGNPIATAMEKAGIVCNSNTVPYETGKAMDPSGIRLGSAAVTTRGFGEKEMRKIANWTDQICKDPENEAVLAKIRQEVLEVCASFPVPDTLVTD